MALQPGARFGRYELVSRLGRGGMAETYRARLVGEAGVTKPVLIKKVLPEYANDEAFTTMFVSEARISATLSHGNIAQVYDFGRVDEEYFLAMEFVDGQPLHRILKRALRTGMSSLPIPIAAFVAIEMCRGLHYAHTRTDQTGKPLGIVHRDISPDNVLISYEGQVKIVDFGIAKARELRGFNTEPGVVKGKYLFFSPEQARGMEVDARTDVWATGVVLYDMLCGQLPVRGPSYVAMPLLVEGRFPRPREINPELPRELDDIVMQALAVDLDERIESCHELGDALAGFLYSAEPRFSAMSLSHFLHQLFREELQAEGRQVQVPRSFLEQMERWSLATVPTNPAQRVAYTPTPPEVPAARPAATPIARSAVVREPQTEDVRDDYVMEGAESEEPVAEAEAASSRKLLYVGGGIGVAVLAILLALAMREPQLDRTHDPSEPRPLVPKSESLPPQKKASPFIAYPDPLIAYPAPPAVKTPQEPAKPPQEVAASPPSAVSAQEERLRREEATVALKDATNLLAEKRYEEAVKMAEQCLEFDPVNADCRKLVGDAYTALGHREMAAAHYRAFLKRAPGDPRARQVEQQLRQVEQQPQRTSSPPPKERPVSERDKEAKVALAAAAKLVRGKQYEEARTMSLRCLELAPDNAECHLLLGVSYAHQGLWDQAAPYYRKFLELAPDHKLAPSIRKTLEDLRNKKLP